MTPLEIEYNKEKKLYKKRLFFAIRDCKFNGAGMRQLIQEFSDEVLGS